RAWVDLLGTLLFLIPFAIMGIWVTVNPVMLSWGRLPDGTFGVWEMSPDPGGLPRAPIKTFIIVAFVALLLQALAQAAKYAAVITGHKEVEAELAAELEAEIID
ncbi:MAG: C4-dicarboxylate ABC transporter substrate-binding protein, partial [Caldilineaceae bacterium]|nr:C4-dicarboxylate ABC transporter substrate-binding protein [Caldilineaceae bacterium]